MVGRTRRILKRSETKTLDDPKDQHHKQQQQPEEYDASHNEEHRLSVECCIEETITFVHSKNTTKFTTTESIDTNVAFVCVEGDSGHANEDRVLIKKAKNFQLFTVIDGHGGSRAADFLVNNLYRVIEELYDDDAFVQSSIIEAIERVERAFCVYAHRLKDYSGACFLSLILYVDKETNTKKKIIINCGDCRAISHTRVPAKSSTSNTKTQQVNALSEDHCATNPSERRRALDAGAFIRGGRIAGVMEPFRSIGDIDMKTKTMKNWIIATPEVHSSLLEEEETTIVLATDGVWSVLSNEEVMKIAKSHLDHPQCGPKSAVDAIMNTSIQKGSYDDISVVVIQLEN